jgi:hypothetical protein
MEHKFIVCDLIKFKLERRQRNKNNKHTNGINFIYNHIMYYIRYINELFHSWFYCLYTYYSWKVFTARVSFVQPDADHDAG